GEENAARIRSVEWSDMRNRAAKRIGRAFTLIELLCVIAIISLVIGIVLPSFSRARATSKLSACASNLRQIVVAIQQYAMDNAGCVPTGRDVPLPSSPPRRWNEWASNQVWVGGGPFENGLGKLVPAYLSDPRVLFCPGSGEPEDMAEEIPKITARGIGDAFCSYLYRQLHEATRASFGDL